MLEMQVHAIALDTSSNSPVIILNGKEDETIMVPIWVGLLEATSIASTMQNLSFDRPMTHDLFKHFMDYIHFKIEKVEITELVDNTFLALIYFSSEGFSFSLDARPSDAISLALKYKAPIFVSESIIEEESGIDPGQDFQMSDVANHDEEEWAEFLKNLSPEAFGKYKM